MAIGQGISATDGLGWTSTIYSIPSGTHHLSFTASNSQYGQITALSSSNGTLSSASSIFSDGVLVPGSGWSGPTDTPPAQGNATANGYTAAENAIARWDVVPYQTFGVSFGVGVIASHSSGIEKVRFGVEGGAWLDVFTTAANAQTANTSGIGVTTDITGKGVYSSGVVEYFATLLASDFPEDGQIEVRAIAYPNIGQPVVLESLYLNANAGGTIPAAVKYVATNGNDTTGDGSSGNPFLTILKAFLAIGSAQGGTANGATIYLKAGSYPLQSSSAPDPNGFATTYAWGTVTCAPGLTRSDVTITGSIANPNGDTIGLTTGRLCIKDVTITGQIQGSAVLSGLGNIAAIWYQGCAFVGPGTTTGFSYRDGQSNRQYAIDCTATNMQDAPDGMSIWRNSAISVLAQSGYHNSELIVNCSCDNINPVGTTGLHPDGLQWTSSVTRKIAYGVKLTNLTDCTGMRIQPSCTDVAIISCQFPAGQAFEMERPYTNLFIVDTDYIGDVYTTGGLVPVDDFIQDCTFAGSSPTPQAGLTIR